MIRVPRRFVFAATTWLASLGCLPTSLATEPPEQNFAGLSEEYAEKTQPLMKQVCLTCHSTAKQEGELDLEQFATLAKVRRGTKVWLKVAEMLDNGEMPPRDAKQPTAEQRRQLRGWIERYLQAEALANAGDPGPVMLRRLSNAEYTYTIRDLTGVPLDPAKEFPADSAAGEGFTNTGNSLVMSPALLTKYLDAGKEIARHAELLPDGFRFSTSASRSDWTNDALARIRALYREHTDGGGTTQVNLQGIIFNTNDGGRLPIEKYLTTTLAERKALQAGSKSIATVAKERGLNAKYLGILWTALTDRESSLLLDGIRTSWLAAKESDAIPLTAEISKWQQTLWRFTSVGHIGRLGGPKAWQEPVVPLTASHEVRLKLPTATDQREVTLFLATNPAGDGSSHDFVVWQQPRLVAPGRPDLLLRDVRDFSRRMAARRETLFASTAKTLAAVDEIGLATEKPDPSKPDVATIAKKYEIDVDALTAWLDYLGMGVHATLQLNHFTNKLTSASNYNFIQGWGVPETPSLMANSSGNHVRIPGNMKPHGVCVHPSPTLSAAVGWLSPIAGMLRVEGKVTHAHPECGNGVTWSLELRRGATRQKLASGVAHGNTGVPIGPIESVTVKSGDLVSLLIGPRDGNHSCDLTDVELTLTTTGESPREWSLTRDVAEDILAGNPHADRFGNPGVWHFYTEPLQGNEAGPVIPVGSLLARWQAADQSVEKKKLASALQQLLVAGLPPGADEKSPDAVLYRQLASLGGPLLARSASRWLGHGSDERQTPDRPSKAERIPRSESQETGLDPALFGKHPDGSVVDAASLCVQAPSVIEVRLPVELAQGAELVTTAVLHPATGQEGSVQVQVATAKPIATALHPESPILVNDKSAARQRFETAFDDFRRVFPAALCYTKIVPVDEVVTLTLFYREDEPLRRLMLSDGEAKQLDRLWEELHFVSQDALTLVNAYEQIMEFATQDRPDMVLALKPLRQPITDRAAAFRQYMVEAEPKQVAALIEFAGRAYRRPLTDSEAHRLRELYRTLREQELPHDEAFRYTLASVFIAPAFLYRLEKAPAGTAAAAISDWELANRLSYFLWSSQPDPELYAAAAAGTLHQPAILLEQAQRLRNDSRVRRLATEFACQWLHIYDFNSLDEKSERHFPEFAELRADMYEESILFFTDLFQRDGSVLSILNADHTYVNERLGKFYGLPDNVLNPGALNPGALNPGWHRVAGMQQHGRGGILGLSATLAKQSGASRTSPILRGNWVSEVLLGEKLPKPPKNVPLLPEDETATDGLTMRELVARHTSDAKCQSCHQKIDPFGFSLEGFDAIGRRRTVDLARRPIDTKTQLPDGRQIEGLEGLREYLVETRRDSFIRQFCRKLLGYSLGRATQLSDEPLIAEMQQRLAKNDFRFSTAVEVIVGSPQFREIRGRDAARDE